MATEHLVRATPAPSLAAGAFPPILLTGSHRSGTTWVGNVLSSAPGTRTIHEPFNISRRGPLRRFDAGLWFRHVDDFNAAEYEPGLLRALHAVAYHREISGMQLRTAQDIMIRIAGPVTVLRQRARGARLILKDPLAVFSAEWLHRRFGMLPLVMIRHPAAFVSSLRVKNWNFDFCHLRDQPALMAGLLAPQADRIERAAARPPDIIEQGILLWLCIYGAVAQYRERHPNWILCRHEDLSRDPQAGFAALFERLGLGFGPKQQAFVRSVSGGQNASEQGYREYRRDSAKNIDNWKKRLSGDEIARIMTGTDGLRQSFYDE